MCSLELLWIPVGAGTSAFQRASLVAWEWVEARRCRRERVTLLHCGLKIRDGAGESFTLEIAPAFIGGPNPPLATGPVGIRGADRLRLFRYQLRHVPAEQLPDEQWAVEAPIRLTGDCGVVDRLLALAPAVPRHVWGRRAPGTTEMWTSDSTIAWLLIKAGVDVASLAIPPRSRAPGWYAGIQLARR